MNIAIIEAAPITPENDAGSRALLDIYLSLKELGHETCFLFESDINLEETLSTVKPQVIFVSRPGLYQRTYQMYEQLDCKVIYIAHDLHFRRLSLQKKLMDNLSPIAASVMKNIEKFCILNSDFSIFPTEEEANYANELFKTNKAICVNYFRFENVAPKQHAGEVKRLIFVGGSDHKPNQDGVTWFVNHVLKEIKIEIPKIQLYVVGRWNQEIQKPLRGEGIEFTGLLSESELFNVMSESDIGVAPLRFGAGMKRKVLNYMAHGIPVVSTTFGIQGLTLGVGFGIHLANSVREWSSSIQNLNNLTYRQTQGREACEYIIKNFSTQRQKNDLKNLLARAEA